MPRIRLVALDLDGTLLNSEKLISPRNLAALAALEERGILMVPITGRPWKGRPVMALDCGKFDNTRTQRQRSLSCKNPTYQ